MQDSLDDMSFDELYALATATPVSRLAAVGAVTSLGGDGRVKLADLVIAALGNTDSDYDGPRAAKLKASLIREAESRRDSEPSVAFAFWQLAASGGGTRVEAIAAFQGATKTHRSAPRLRSAQIEVVALALRGDWERMRTVLRNHPEHRVHVRGQTRFVVEPGVDVIVETVVQASGARADLWLPWRWPIRVPSDAARLFIR